MNFKELYSTAEEQLSMLSNLEDSDFRLEQAEYLEDEDIWEIIVSYLVPNINRSESGLSILNPANLPYNRIYKRVKINNKKEVVGFYMYTNK